MGDRRVRTLRTAVLVLAAIFTSRVVVAQTTPPPSDLSSLLPELILRGITLPTPTTPGLSHSAHFSPFAVADLENPAVAIVEGFNKLMVVQLSTFPIGSSSGGFSYAFDPTLGTFRRASSSFGPLFAERAATIGRGRFSAGFNYQHSSYDRFEGSALDNGEIKFYLRHQECCTTGSGPAVPPFFGVDEHPDGTLLNPFFEGDLIEAALSLDVKTDMVAIFGNYGLTDRWDVGVAVPFVRVDMDASVLATIQRLATVATPRSTRSKPATRTRRRERSARATPRPASATSSCGRRSGSSTFPPAASPRQPTSGCQPVTKTICSAAARR